MNLLLDTHALIWFADDGADLSATARMAIIDPRNDVVVSMASAWQMAIKLSIGKLTLGRPLPDLLRRVREEQSIDLLEIELADVLAVAGLPHHHRDPFDRLIVAEALRRGLTVVTTDAAFPAYGVKTLW